jgi:hypothetical protein
VGTADPVGAFAGKFGLGELYDQIPSLTTYGMIDDQSRQRLWHVEPYLESCPVVASAINRLFRRELPR